MHTFALNGGSCGYYPSNLFCNVCSFEIWRTFSDILQFYLENIQAHDIYINQYLIDCKRLYTELNMCMHIFY